MPITPKQSADRNIVVEWAPCDRNAERKGIEDPPFEIGLAQAGAISAGAYTAGVIDFLIEALDAWEAARKPDAKIPSHRVQLRVITGASAGGIAAALTAAVVGRNVSHVRTVPKDETAKTNNPLFDAWVNDIDIAKLLTFNDLDAGGPVMSLLDSTSLMEIGKKALSTAGALPPKKREWVQEPLRVILTTPT